jgi:polysaccharide biosynthesis protein PslG
MWTAIAIVARAGPILIVPDSGLSTGPFDQAFGIWGLSFIMIAVTASQRQRITRLALLDLLILLTLALLLFARRDDVRQFLVNLTGEEDTARQLGALGYLAVSSLQPAPQTSDFTPMRYTDVPPFGVNTFLEQEVEESKIRASLKLIHDAGITFIRQEFPWESIEQPAKGQFWDAKFNHSAWDKYDLIVNLAQEYGLQIVARLDTPPAWTRHDGDARGSFAPPDNYDDYGDFVAAVVSRYRGKIKYYQLWNEPNIYPEWGDQPVSAADYVRLLKIGYTRAKEADPNVVVLTAGLAPTKEMTSRNLSDLVFLQQMYDEGARGHFDILAVQDYGLFWGPGNRLLMPDRPNFSRPLLIRDIMVKNGDAATPIWAMEIGWNALPTSFSDAPYGRVTDEQQARYTVQAYQRAQQEWPWMGAMFYWFFKRADDHEKNQPFYYFRMFDPDFTPHPVYAALKAYIPTARFLGIGFHSVDHWALNYQGAWRTATGSADGSGSYKIGQPGDSLSLTFQGTTLELAVVQNPYGGIVDVTIDGAPERVVDLRATDPESGGRVSLARVLPDGPHHASIKVLRGQLLLGGIVVRRTYDGPIEALGAVAVVAMVIVVGWALRR